MTHPAHEKLTNWTSVKEQTIASLLVSTQNLHDKKEKNMARISCSLFEFILIETCGI